MAIRDYLTRHCIDSLATISLSNPIMSALEVSIADMSALNAAYARTVGTCLTFAGLGSAYSRGRDFSSAVFDIPVKGPKRVIHDITYTAAFLGVVQPLSYYAAGVRDWKQITIGTLATVGASLVSGAGGLMGYVIDIYRELACINRSERLPHYLETKSNTYKKATLAATSAVSALTTATIIYTLGR